MSFLKDISIGIAAYGQAIRFIFRNKLAIFFLIPITLNLLLVYLGYGFINSWTTSSIEYFQSTLSMDDWDFWGSEFLVDTIGFLIWLILRLFFFLLFAFIGGYVILILMSPLLAYVSEKTEKIISRKDYPFSWTQLFKDALRGIMIAMRNFFLESAAIVILFFLSFIPLMQLISTPLLFLVSAYFYGFSFMDYTCERRRLKMKESVQYIRRNKGLAIANGSLFALCLLIPVVGVSLSGFVAIISSVAATIAILKKEEQYRIIS